MRHCTHCGAQLREGSTFCTACGTVVPPAPAPAPAPAAPVKPRGRRGRRALLALVAVLLVVAVGTGAGYWLWSTPPAIDPAQVEVLVIP